MYANIIDLSLHPAVLIVGVEAIVVINKHRRTGISRAQALRVISKFRLPTSVFNRRLQK